MKDTNFIWADLSSYHPEEAKSFYQNVFNWKFYGKEYCIAYKKDKQIVGLYQTPPKFKALKMPSFWMSYIQVKDVLKIVEKAKSIGGIIELVDTKNTIGKIALIRDTLGAGFTIYEGNQLNSKTSSEENTLIFNELHVSDIEKAVSFYKNLFDWDFKKVNLSTRDVYSKISAKKIATIRQIDNSIKGKYEYWTCVFGVSNIKNTLSKITDNKGLIISEEENRVLCSDGSEAFFYIQKV